MENAPDPNSRKVVDCLDDIGACSNIPRAPFLVYRLVEYVNLQYGT